MSGTAEILGSWFQRAADTVGTLVHQCDGAMRIRLVDLQAACERIDDDLRECPYPQVWSHITCQGVMKRCGLCIVKAVEDDGIVVFYDPMVHSDPESALLYSMLLDDSTVAVG